MAPSAAPDLAFLRDPHAMPTAEMAWWAWWDQGLYQKAAVAWANGVLEPAFHWYLPGYPLFGAAFVPITPADPFLLPNLASLLGTLWLFCGVASRLLKDVPLRIPVACILFVATSLSPRVLWSWVVPWTTTPETFCIFGALLGAIRLVEGGKRRDAFLTGLATAAIAGFRPADAGVMGLAICAVAGPALLSRHRRLGIFAAAAGGAMIPLLVFGGAYLATWGTKLSSYLVLSSQIGFEPRLFTLRWVALMLDPRPLYPGGRGLAQVFFWVLPGFAGMAATLLTARHAAAIVHRLVIAVLVGDVALFMTYRDLHPTGLWDHGNYHYFKWTLPLFALYAFRLIPTVLNQDRRRPLAIAVACLTVPALSCWRTGISQMEPLQADKQGSSITVESGLRPVSAMVLVPGHGPGAPPVVNGSAETASGTVLRYGFDFVIYGADETLRVVPLRPLPPEPTIIRFSEGTELNRELAPLLVRQTLTWSLPFWLAGGPQAHEALAR